MSIPGTNAQDFSKGSLSHDACINNTRIRDWHSSRQFKSNAYASLQRPHNFLKTEN